MQVFFITNRSNSDLGRLGLMGLVYTQVGYRARAVVRRVGFVLGPGGMVSGLPGFGCGGCVLAFVEGGHWLQGCRVWFGFNGSRSRRFC